VLTFSLDVVGEPSQVTIEPSSGSTQGGTTVFADLGQVLTTTSYQCRFGSTSVYAWIFDTTGIFCISPSAASTVCFCSSIAIIAKS
jgi:hypothetical protein